VSVQAERHGRSLCGSCPTLRSGGWTPHCHPGDDVVPHTPECSSACRILPAGDARCCASSLRGASKILVPSPRTWLLRILVLQHQNKSIKKCKVVLVHIMQAYGRSQGIAPLIITLTLDVGEWWTSHISYFMTVPNE